MGLHLSIIHVPWIVSKFGCGGPRPDKIDLSSAFESHEHDSTPSHLSYSFAHLLFCLPLFSLSPVVVPNWFFACIFSISVFDQYHHPNIRMGVPEWWLTGHKHNIIRSENQNNLSQNKPLFLFAVVCFSF